MNDIDLRRRLETAPAHTAAKALVGIALLTLIGRGAARVVGAMRNASGTRAAQNETAPSEAQLRLALGAAGMAVWQSDLANGLIHGPEFNAIFGFPPDQRLTPDDVRARYLPGELVRIREATKALFESGAHHAELEYRIRRLDGEVRWILMRGELARNADGDPRGLVGVCMDITERKEAEERLAEANAARDREREARMTSMDAVAAAIAHEVGQPLAAVMLNTTAGIDWLSRDPPNAERGLKALQVTAEAGRRAFDVLKSIRTTFAQGSGSFTEFSFNDLVRDTVTLVEKDLAAQKISVRLTLDASLPPIQANRVQIQRVILNLLTNAIDSLADTPRRSRRVSLRSSLAGAEGVLLDVRDSGVAIAPEEMAHIFEPFFTTKSNGMGLGLSLSRTIVEDHGGRLWASSGARGATFHLQLPSRPTPTA